MTPRNYPVWHWKEPGQTLKGTLQGQIPGYGKVRSNCYIIKEGPPGGRGKSWRVYGTYRIDLALTLAMPGTTVIITFLGKKPSDKNPKRTFYEFKVNTSGTGKPFAEIERAAAARRVLARQRTPRPGHAVGRAAAVAQPRKIENEKKKRGRPRKHDHHFMDVPIAPPAPPPEYIAANMPIPVPPAAARDNAFMDNWSKKIKKL